MPLIAQIEDLDESINSSIYLRDLCNLRELY